jgi:hypothetical protein
VKISKSRPVGFVSAALAFFGVGLASFPARADVSIPVDIVASGAIKVNGVLSEWPGAMTALNVRVSGAPGGDKDLSARGGLATDDQNLYVGLEITDDKLVRTASYGPNEDRAMLVIAVPGEGGSYTAIEVDLFVGDPGNVAGAVRIKGASVPGSTLVEAAQKGGYTFEAKIPWAALGVASKMRVGLRGALRVGDSDGGPVKTVIGTAGDVPPGKLPHLLSDAERAIEETFAKEKGLSGAPQHDAVADVTGDDLRERVIQWDKFVLVAGPGIRGGKEFFFHDLGIDRGSVVSFEVRDVTGDGKAELLVKKRRGNPGTFREIFEILSFSGEGISPLFAHDIGVTAEQGSITSNVKIAPDGKQIDISLGAASGLTAATFKDEGGDGTLLLPWGTVKSRTFKMEGGHFNKVKEESKPAGDTGGGAPGKAPAGPPEPPAPPAPRPPTADEMQEHVLGLYRRDRKVKAGEKPRFDLATNVAGDAQIERLLVFGRDLVVFGKGFLGGQGYVAVSLGLADPKDVADVTTRDLTGDGRAEIILRGVQRLKAPKELGEKGTVDREVLLVYTVIDDKLIRVFAAETGLAVGDKRITGTIAFLPSTKGMALELGPGHAIGWDEKSYPYKQDTTPVSGIEPLILPWTSSGVRYTWSGSAFSR